MAERMMVRIRLQPDIKAILLAIALALLTLIWNGFVGITLRPPIWLLMIVPAGLLLVSGYYIALKPLEWRLFQIPFYAALWIIFPLFGILLTYLGSTLAFPFQDATFATADTALGFDWIEWVRFIIANPAIENVARMAYASSFYQPFLAVALLALFGKRYDNARFLIATILALLVTAVPHALWPSLGPASASDIPNRWTDVVLSLRAGQVYDLPYVGIITFPSFHAAMAVLFTIAYRNIPVAMIFSGALNAMMMTSVLYPGGHYFIDVPVGLAIALSAYWLSGKLL